MTWPEGAPQGARHVRAADRGRCLSEWGAHADLPGDAVPEAWLDSADACDASLGGAAIRRAGPMAGETASLRAPAAVDHIADAIASARIR